MRIAMRLQDAMRQASSKCAKRLEKYLYDRFMYLRDVTITLNKLYHNQNILTISCVFIISRAAGFQDTGFNARHQ
jgi:hypothetical protein